MYHFQAVIHARPGSSELAWREIRIAAEPVRVLEIPPTSFTALFECTFEDAIAALAALPRMFVELDGSFVWRGTQQGEAWQLDGVLYDRQDRLAHVEVGGVCPVIQFDQFLQALGWPATPLVFQLRNQGLFVDEPEFRRLAEAASAN